MTSSPRTRTPRTRSLLALVVAGCSTALVAPTVASATPHPAAVPAHRPVQAATPPVVDLTITQMLSQLRTHRTTSVALVQAYLARIKAYDGSVDSRTGLNAIVTVNPHALREARELDRERRAGHLRGLLHGVPIIVKDNYATAEMPTSAGSASLATYQTRVDSTVVARLRAAGAIIIAKANMSEFAWHGTYTRSSVTGVTGNAFDPTLSASGSSGGSAVSVAASYAPAAFGTDSCGSIIGPSAHSSSVGFRPTVGRISTYGIVPLSIRQDAAGPIARTVEDAALLAQVVEGPDGKDANTAAHPTRPNLLKGLRRGALKGRRIGYLDWTQAQWDALNPNHYAGEADVLKATKQAEADMRAAGATMVALHITHDEMEKELPSGGWIDSRPSIDAFLASMPARWPAGLASRAAPWNKLTFADIVADGRSSLEQSVIDAWMAQKDLPNADFDAAVKAQDAGKKRIDAFFRKNRLDAVVAPTSIATANQAWAGTSFCDIGANTGVPSVSVPSGVSSTGLPIGLEMLGRRDGDADLLAMAYAYTTRHHHHVVPANLPELRRR